MSCDGLVDKVERAIEGTPWMFEMGECDEVVYALFEAHSPAGEDYCIEETFDVCNPISFGGIQGLVHREYESFDADEHAAMWVEYRGKRGVPKSIRTLIEDAEAIELMLKELDERMGEQ